MKLRDAARSTNQSVQYCSSNPKGSTHEMVLPAGGALKMNMTVEDVRIEVNNQDLQLKVKFGFSQKQLTDQNQST